MADQHPMPTEFLNGVELNLLTCGKTSPLLEPDRHTDDGRQVD